MALRDRIFQPVGVATATPATVATVKPKNAGSVATVATVAVAVPQSVKTKGDLPAELDRLIDLVGRHYNTPADEYPIIRETAAKDPEAALRSYRLMALEIDQEAHQGDNSTSMDPSPLPEIVSCLGCIHHELDPTPGRFNPICKIHAALPFVRWHAGINVLARGCAKKTVKTAQTDPTTTAN